MFSYETGVGIAALLWLYNSIMIIVTVNSQLERNLNRIGQRLSWVALTPKEMEPDDLKKSTLSKVMKYLFIVGFGLPFILTSWLYVLLAAAAIIYRIFKDVGAPQAVREMRWRLRNQDLTFDQLVRELMKAQGQDLSAVDDFKAKIVAELEERGLKHGY